MTRNPRRIPIGELVSIYQRGKRGIWTAEWHSHRKHRRKTLKTRNLRLARQRGAALDRQLTEGGFNGQVANIHTRACRTLITTAIDQFKSYCETEGRRRKTHVKYVGILKKFAAFAATQDVSYLSEIDLAIIDRYRAAQKQRLAPKSMHHKGATLKLFLSWAKSRGHLSSSPLADVHFTPPQQEPRGGPTLEQVNAILKAASDRERPILSMLAFTGMRSGEVQRALKNDIDLKANWAHVKSRPGAETKNGQSRKMPIHPRLRAILEALPKRSDGYFFKAEPSDKYPNGDHHINAKRLNESFLRVLNFLEVPAGRNGGFTIHSLRHFFRTFCTNAGVPDRVIDIWMGHAADKSMGAVYFKLTDEASQEWMTKVPFGDGKPAADVGDNGGEV